METAFRSVGSNRHFIVDEVGPGEWQSLEGKVGDSYAVVFLPHTDEARKWVETQQSFPTGRMALKGATKQLCVVFAIDYPVGDEWAIKASMEFYDAVEHANGHGTVALLVAKYSLLPF